jgi:cytochrome c oxidase subunit IV
VVAAYFMHLKWDKKLLTGIFYAGLVLAVAVYVAVLFAFEFFSGNWA